MKPAPFAYLRPTALTDAVSALAADPTAKVLAGGQSLVPLLNMRLAGPSTLVDINALPDLDRVQVDETGVRIGALARHNDVLHDDRAARVQPLLRLALDNVAHATIRNRGTTVGSIVHADPAAEMPMVLRLLGGSVDVVGSNGRRTIAADELFLGPLESSLATDEIAVEAFLPALPADAGVAFEEIARRHGDYAMVGAATVVRRDPSSGAVTSALIGYLSVSDLPEVVDVTELLAEGTTPAALGAAGRAALERLDPVGDVHATAEYRSHLVQVLTQRVLVTAYEAAGSGHHTNEREGDR